MLDSSKSPNLASGGSSFSMRFLEWYWLYVSVPSFPANFQIISGPPGCSGANCVLKDQSFFFHLPSCPLHSSHSLTLDRSYTLPLTTTQQSSADECLAISATGTLEPSRCAMMLVAACIS